MLQNDKPSEDDVIAQRAILCIQLEKITLSAVVNMIFYPAETIPLVDEPSNDEN
jgi:hypothetical protein